MIILWLVIPIYWMTRMGLVIIVIRTFMIVFCYGRIKLVPVGQFQYWNYWTIQIVMFVVGKALNLPHSLIWRENRYKKLIFFVRYMWTFSNFHCPLYMSVAAWALRWTQVVHINVPETVAMTILCEDVTFHNIILGMIDISFGLERSDFFQ